MTTRSISNQVKTIKSATAKATASKEAAVAFLRQAGIIGKSPVTVVKVGRSNTQVATAKVGDVHPSSVKVFRASAGPLEIKVAGSALKSKKTAAGSSKGKKAK